MPIKRKKSQKYDVPRKKNKNKNKNSDMNFEIDSDIASGDEETGVLENDSTIGGSESVAAVTKPNISDEETLEEKKNRLTREYLDSIKQDVDDDDAINEQLHIEALESQSKLFHQYADSLRDKTIEYKKIRTHKKAVTSIKISGDGTHIYTASKDNCMIKWDTEYGKKINMYYNNINDNPDLGRNNYINCLTEQDNIIFYGDNHKNIIICDTRTKNNNDKLKGHGGSITALSTRENSKSLYSGSDDRTIKIWNIPERAYVESLYGHEEPVRDLDTIVEDRAVSSSSDNTVRLWKVVEESQLIFRGSAHSNPVIERVRFLTPQFFVSATQAGSVDLYNISKKKSIFSVKATQDSTYWCTSLATLHNSDLVFSGSWDNKINIYKFNRNNYRLDFINKIAVDGIINDMCVSNNGILVGAIGNEHRLGRWYSFKSIKNGFFISKLDMNLANH